MNIFKHKWMSYISLIIICNILVGTLYFFFHHDSMLYHIVFITLNFSMIALLIYLLATVNKTTKDLQKSNQRLNSIFDSLDVAIWSHDLKEDNLMITPGMEKLYGYSLDEFYRDQLLWKKVIYPEDLQVIEQRQEELKGGKPVTNFYRIVKPDGEVRWIRDRGIPVFDEKGNFVDFTSVLFDVTDNKEREERYRGLVEMSPDIIAVIRNWKFDYINEAGSKLLGEENPCDLIGKSILRYMPTKSVLVIKEALSDMISSELEKKRFETEIVRFDGNTIDIEISVMNILYEGREARLIVGRDITERKKAHEIIHQMAYYDSLTGLPNRNMFKDYLNECLSKADDNNMVAVLFIDLDRFKIVNDTKGHSTGDLLLQKAAKRLLEAVSDQGMVSRQGGDEFIILLESTSNKEIEEVADRILQVFSQPFDLNGDEFFVTPSVGISLYPVDGKDQETLIKNADTAMYLAKERGKNNYQYYTSSLQNVSTRKMELEVGLRKALAEDHFEVYYQPQYKLDTREVCGVEALLRWKHSKLGMISPVEFISLAEETGLIVPIGRWVLRKVCEQHKLWKDAGLGAVPVAVNVSVRQIQDLGFVDDVKQALEDFKLDPADLELEITESIMQNIEFSRIVLKKLKELGVKIAIDDFGKGYSSLSYLKYLPIDKIKIDKSFVDDILDSGLNGSIAKAIIEMSHTMNFSVIAEGIEEERQLIFLLENSCKLGQGYLLSRPLDMHGVTEVLTGVLGKK
ncbi:MULTISPECIES: sensor domain-containing protein [Bacillaceae]|uniref:sensor domain-containing protein n=1 Tax=Bacillaceae TaxID=186817 RepID=UPI000BFDB241|nr:MULTISPECIES: GGDEF and EAL domain-containing protein [Bacillaceae]PGT88991.1 GGDEF domain-containing protein [Bacillus sp. AFS040349]UGB30614.1 EAL domain-containing protein [Metabacillus sp. B2-18]